MKKTTAVSVLNFSQRSQLACFLLFELFELKQPTKRQKG
jgi:hypothetical protein